MARRVGCGIVLVLAAAALITGAQELVASGWGPALRSVADRVLPNPEVVMWAPAPAADAAVSSYADATGAGENHVYLVDAADADGDVRELQLIFFGHTSPGSGWLEIEARSGSGVHYRSCAEADVPDAAREALDGPAAGIIGAM